MQSLTSTINLWGNGIPLLLFCLCTAITVARCIMRVGCLSHFWECDIVGTRERKFLPLAAKRPLGLNDKLFRSWRSKFKAGVTSQNIFSTNKRYAFAYFSRKVNFSVMLKCRVTGFYLNLHSTASQIDRIFNNFLLGQN